MKVYINKTSIAIHGSVELAAIAKVLKARKVEQDGNIYFAKVDNKVITLEKCTRSNALYSITIEYTENKERKNKMLYLRKKR